MAENPRLSDVGFLSRNPYEGPCIEAVRGKCKFSSGKIVGGSHVCAGCQRYIHSTCGIFLDGERICDGCANQNPAAEPFDAGRVRELMRRLTERYVPLSAADKALKSAILLVDSAIATAPSLKGVDSLVQALLTRLVRDGRQNDAMSCATLAASLKVSDGLSSTSLWSVLYVLSDLKGSGAGKEAGGVLAAAARARKQNLYTESPIVRSALPPTLTESPFTPAKPDDDANRARIFETTTPKFHSKKQSSVEFVSHSVALEDNLLQDLLLIIQGADGRHVKFSGHEFGENIEFSSSIANKLSQPMKDITKAISEMGFLFRTIRRRTEEVDEKKNGWVLVNFARAVESELDAYYKSIVSLQNSAKGDDSSVPDSKITKLTLRRLLVWAESEKEKLRCLARICEEVKPLRGGQVLAHIRTYRTSSVASEIQTMLAHIFSRSAAPLNKMLQRWLTEGVIDDPHDEFFVMVDPHVAAAAAATAAKNLEGGNAFDTMIGGPNAASGASNRIWWGLFKVRSNMLPSSRNRKLAEKALVVGKSIAFLRRCCGDSEWVDSVHTPSISALLPKSVSVCKDKGMLGFAGFGKLVEKADKSASERLMSLFFDKFDLSHHFAAIKRYLLLSQGDFTQSLIDSLSKILDGDGQVLLNSVTGIVDIALRSASSFNEETDQDILERLNVKILAQTEERKIGWDMFSLTYRVEDAPLNTVFSPKVMEAYLLIFKFLWRLKRMDHLLSESYVCLCTHKYLRDNDDSTSENLIRLGASLRKAHYLRMKMMHLVQNIQYYCTFEVLEGSWTVLERDMANSKNLSALIEAHAQYLVAIKDRTLLAERSRSVLKALNETLDTIPVFHDEVRRLSREVTVCTGRGGTSPLRQHEGARFNSVNTSVNGSANLSVHDALEAVEKRFDLNFALFLNVLRAHSSVVDNCLFLAFRLDFNGYFGNRRESMGN